MSSPRVDEAVARVALWRGRDVKVSPLSGGLTNENYLVDVEGERYVMRVPGQSTELLSIDRDNEVYNTIVVLSNSGRELPRAPDDQLIAARFPISERVG